jgi:hypothetical protein
MTARPNPAGSPPHGALLSLRAKGLQALLNDWNTSRGRRDCLKETDYEAFSRWRLFDRLSQPQIKFSIAQRSLRTRIYLAQATDSDHLFFCYSCIMANRQFSSTIVSPLRQLFEVCFILLASWTLRNLKELPIRSPPYTNQVAGENKILSTHE